MNFCGNSDVLVCFLAHTFPGFLHVNLARAISLDPLAALPAGAIPYFPRLPANMPVAVCTVDVNVAHFVLLYLTSYQGSPETSTFT